MGLETKSIAKLSRKSQEPNLLADLKLHGKCFNICKQKKSFFVPCSLEKEALKLEQMIIYVILIFSNSYNHSQNI